MVNRFPADRLIARSGSIAAFVFENRSINLPRSLWWCVTLEFEQIVYAGSTWTCSMSVDWIPWKLRTWTDLSNRHLRCLYGDDGVETTFYFVEHDYGSSVDLRIGENDSGRFPVQIDMVVEFTGYLGDDADEAMRVRDEAIVPFTGLVIPDSLFPKVTTADLAAGVASAFVDVSTFMTPEPQANGWVLRPKTAVV